MSSNCPALASELCSAVLLALTVVACRQWQWFKEVQLEPDLRESGS